MLFIPVGTVIENSEALKAFKTRKNTFPETRLVFENGTPVFDVEFTETGFQSYEYISFRIEAKQVDGGYEVVKVRKFVE